MNATPSLQPAPPPNFGHVVAVIPCRNEARTIGQLVCEVKRHLHNVIVVDNGSEDETAIVARAAGADVLDYGKQHGKGAALQAGWTEAASRSFEWALFMDGDGQHDPGDIPAFLSFAGNGVSLVCGNRMHDAARMPVVRRIVNRWMSLRISRMTGLAMPDTQCGFRLAHLPELIQLGLKSSYFEIESEMCAAFALAGRTIEWTDIRVRYGVESSKILLVPDTLRWFRWYWSFRRKRRLLHK